MPIGATVKPGTRPTDPLAVIVAWAPLKLLAARAEAIELYVVPPVETTLIENVHVPLVHAGFGLVVLRVQLASAGSADAMSLPSTAVSSTETSYKAVEARRAACRAPSCAVTPNTKARPRSIMPITISNINGATN